MTASSAITNTFPNSILVDPSINEVKTVQVSDLDLTIGLVYRFLIVPYGVRPKPEQAVPDFTATVYMGRDNCAYIRRDVSLEDGSSEDISLISYCAVTDESRQTIDKGLIIFLYQTRLVPSVQNFTDVLHYSYKELGKIVNVSNLMLTIGSVYRFAIVPYESIPSPEEKAPHFDGTLYMGACNDYVYVRRHAPNKEGSSPYINLTKYNVSVHAQRYKIDEGLIVFLYEFQPKIDIAMLIPKATPPPIPAVTTAV